MNQALNALDTEQPDYEAFDEKALDGTEEVTEETSETSEDTAQAEGSPTETEPTVPKGQGFIPRHRYNFAQQKRMEAEQRANEYEQRIAELEAKQQQAAESAQESKYSPQERIRAIEAAVNQLDEQIEEARADGNTREAARLQSETRRLERALVWEINQLNAATTAPRSDTSAQATQQAIAAIKTEQLIHQLEAQYPMLQEGHQLFDPELSDEVMDLFDSLSKDLSPQDALARAVQYVTSSYNIRPFTAATVKQTNVKRNLDAANRQPPDMHRVGLDSTAGGPARATDVMKMTQDDFERLGDADIEKLLV